MGDFTDAVEAKRLVELAAEWNAVEAERQAKLDAVKAEWYAVEAKRRAVNVKFRDLFDTTENGNPV